MSAQEAQAEPAARPLLEPDRDQLEIFVEALFRHAGSEGFVTVRSFLEGNDKVFRISSAALSGGLRFLIDVAEDDARRAAQAPQPVVFCPPLAVFSSKDRAREQDLLAGLALSVECDEHPQEARATLEQLLGPATVVVKSGGQWMNGGAADKLHLHWRLACPARGGNLAKLKQARDLAARIVGGDLSNKPVCHPIRWPGSWHRKGEPRLCQIETLEADREIDIDTVLATLTAAAPVKAATAPDDDAEAGPAEDWPGLIVDIVTGKSFHRRLVELSARLVGSKMHDGTSVKLLRALMLASTAPHDEQRWQPRFDSIPRLVASAREKYAVKPDGHILPGSEFADLSTASRKVWLAHHLLAIGEISVWYGEPGSGKSAGLEDLGLHIAAGRIWHGRQVKRSAVLYVALERAAVVERRALAWGLEHGRARERLPFKVIRGPLDFRDPQVAVSIVATLEDLAQRHGCEAGLIIVDTVSRALCGGDENSPKDMGALIANTGRIQSAIGVHIALTHHQPVDGKERMRGHGALLGAVDTTIHVTNKDGMRLAEVVKSSDHEEGQRVGFALKSVIIDQDDGYGDPVTAPVVVEEIAPSTKATKRVVRVPKNATLALNALRGAVADCGQRVANDHVPGGVQVVTLDQWRTYAFRRGLGGEEANSRKKAFTRASECLAGSGLVGIWEPYAWPL